MTDPIDRHAPSEEFVDYLARDIRRELRHEARFAASRSRWAAGRPSRGMTTIVTLAASGVLTLFTGIVLGASANHAAAAAPSDEHSRFAFRPIRDAFQVIGCAAVPAAPPPSRTADGESRGRSVATVDIPAVARSAQAMGAVVGVVETADGRLLVNDAGRRQLRLFESDLGSSTVALDSTRGTRSYGLTGPGTIGGTRGAKFFFPFVGDSSVLGPDGPPDHSLTVLDERGRPARTIPTASLALPPGITDGVAAFDGRGRLVYRHSPTASSSPTVVEVPPPPPRADGLNPFGGRGAGSGTMRLIVGRADTLPLVRVDFETRVVDTVAHIALPPDDAPGINGVGNGGGKLVPVPGADGRPARAKQVIDPLPVVDDWAMLADGTIGIVRGRDYHVDWIHPDGRRSASAPLPYEWQTLSEADRRRIVDSTRAVVDSLDRVAEENARRDLAARDSAKNAPRIPAGGRGGGRGGRGSITGTVAGGTITLLDQRGARGMGAGVATLPAPPRSTAVLRAWPYEIVAASRIPDRYPPIRTGSVRADEDGNLWILPRTAATSGEQVYDVVNPRDGLVRRVRIPSGRTIAGFGKGGVIYLNVSEPGSGILLERIALSGSGSR